MKTSLTVQELAIRVSEEQAKKADFIVDASVLKFEPEADGSVVLTGIDDIGQARVRPIAHGQFANLTGVPKKYYDKMLSEAPDLLCRNLNHWLEVGDHKRLVRTMDGEVRAVLSDRYRMLDNADFVAAVVPALMRIGAEIRSCEMTEDKLYLKAVAPGETVQLLAPGTEMGRGHDRFDELQSGLVISNSEVGSGRLMLQPAIHTTGCTNLAIRREDAMARTHLGSKLGSNDAIVERYITSATRAKEDEAIWNALADIAAASLDGRILEDAVKELQVARGIIIEGEVAPKVEKVCQRLDFTEGETNAVLEELMRSGDLSQYGVHSAVTRISQDVEDYQRATELEMAGMDVIALPSTLFTAS